MRNEDWPTTEEGWPVVFLPPAVYDAAERAGFDMRQYRRVEPIPTKIMDWMTRKFQQATKVIEALLECGWGPKS
jgi:hypothetical protein